ncbi:acyl-CoA-binding protein, putative [Plasmodium gallinaceum]|uniref:Acyl-CoA-binding protein, putative n=1 Tax=Plasmodium gallinaceum TaxID=5849 RepID=A0A1J1GVG9_PLAGA|nr:acyl-CoA-binding protein, putative [Plasmodium gallinaceum]CRG96238.1 acyl-CoA-binding protein, putative [Plasmodium gallinaceum]
MFRNISKPAFAFNVVSVVVIIYLLTSYRKKSHILDKLYDLKNWLFNGPFSFYKKYIKIKLPPIDKNITINISDEELEEKFSQTCNAVKIYRNKLKFEEWIYLYGLYKQITNGNIKLNNDEEIECNDYNNNENNNNKKKNDLKLSKNDYIENEKINSWKNCYDVDKKVCKFLYVEFFNKLFPNAIENLNSNLSFEFSKSISKMKSLKENNYTEDNTDNNLCDLLCHNVVFSNIEYVKKILDSHPHLISQKNSDGLTALHYACDRGHLEIAKLLVERGADINMEDSYGDTALHIAAYSDKKEIIDYLTSVGADIDKKNSDGLTVGSILNQK